MKPPFYRFYRHVLPFPYARVVGVALVLLLSFLQRLHAQSFPANFSGTQLATGLDPVALDVAPDGRVFITEKAGRIRIVKNGSLLPTPFATIPDVDNYNERGLQGIALDPNFSQNGYVYVYYTHRPGNNNRVTRFTADGDVARGGSEQVIFNIDRLSGAGVHNGGGLFFQDGKLFVLTGENANPDHSQSLSTLKGKILRINPDGSIPSDNPFYNQLGGDLRAIWALGLRNPFHGAAQPGTGRIYVNDVGQNTYEEINEGGAGRNFGWPGIEGPRGGQAPPANYANPVFAYDHSASGGCAITGGTFYNPSSAQFPAQYVGKYFFSDYCFGWIRMLDPSNGSVTPFATGITQPLAIRTSSDGALYFIARNGRDGGSEQANTSSGNGVLWKVTYTGSGAPTIGAHPTDKTSSVGGSVTFSVNASGTPAPSYQWQRNGSDIAGANSANYTLNNVSQGDNGAKFRVVVSNSGGSVTSNEATLTVSSNQKPTATITTPGTGATYSGGDVIRFEGKGTDPEDGNLPASAFTWAVDLYHYDPPAHTHPAMAPLNGVTSGTFTIPTSGETSPNVAYRIYLTVRDSQGATHTQQFDVQPNRAKITLASNPDGLELKLDGSSVRASHPFTGVSKIERNLDAPETQNVNGSSFTFLSWSDGGARTHTIATPSSDQTITAQYMRSADNPANLTAGLEYAYYQGTFNQLPDFNSLPTVKTGKIADFSLSPASRGDEFAIRFKGYIQVPANGKYTFYTASDDGSRLYIGNILVVNNDGLHSTQEASGSIFLQAGKHPIEVTYFENNGDQVLTVSYEGPGVGKQTIPASALSGGGSAPTTDTQAPSAPGNLTSANVTQTGLTLNWSGSTDNVGVTVYEIYRGTDKIGETSSTSFNVTGLTAGTGYGFTVKAKDAAGNVSGGSATLNVTTQTGGSTNPPPAQGGGGGGGGGCTPTVTYVSDLNPQGANNGWGPFERDRSNNEQGSGDGRTITLNGQTYAKGLGVHASSEISYNLGGNWNRFKAHVGIDDEINSPRASMVFEVWADGQRLFQSGMFRHDSPTQQIDVDVTGKQQLKLIVNGAGDGVDYDHGDWADARLEKICSAPAPSPAPTPSAGSIFEAENASLWGAQASNFHPGYTGTGFADYIAGSGDYIEWTFDVPSAGMYTLGFRYGLGASNDRPLELRVNGGVIVNSLSFPPTPSWTDWQYVNANAPLQQGINTVRLTAIGSSGANIDHLRIAPRSGRLAATSVESRAADLYVYPNPADEYLYLSGALLGEAPLRSVQLISLEGRVVAKPTLEESRIDLRPLPTGMYLLRVESERGVRQFKVMKR
jgi:glucose/arabinose dehydrogenase